MTVQYLPRMIMQSSRGKGSRGPNAKTRLRNGDTSVRIPPSRRKRKLATDDDDSAERVVKRRPRQLAPLSGDEKEGGDDDDDPETPLTKKVTILELLTFLLFHPHAYLLV